MKPLQVLVPNRGISWGSWSREQEWCTAVFPLGRSNTDILLTAFPCANLRNCLLSDCCSSMDSWAWLFLLPLPECRTNVHLVLHTSSHTSLMFQEPLTYLQACIATSDANVCSSGAAWLSPLFKKDCCCFSLFYCAPPELVKVSIHCLGLLSLCC